MFQRHLLLVILAIVFFGGLIIWQTQVISEKRELEYKIYYQNVEQKLSELSFDLMTRYNKKEMFLKDIDESNITEYKAEVDSALLKIYGETAQKFSFGIFSEKEKILLTNTSDVESVYNSDLKVCIGCVIFVAFGDTREKKIINHSPAQMVSLFNKTSEEIKYLALSIPPPDLSFSSSEYIALIFVIGLSTIFGISLYKLSQQKKLLNQKDTFINHLSHQFKTPLASIRLGTKYLLKSQDEDRNKEILQLMDLEGNILEKHVQTVLHWIKSDRGNINLNREAIFLYEHIQDVLNQMSLFFKEHKTTVEIDSIEKNDEINGDSYHITLVLFNLCENAVKHNAKPINLKFSIRRNEKHTVLAVSDNGKGFAKNDKPGLGLQYVGLVMKLHNGRFDMHQQQNNGALIELKFPKDE